MFQFVYRGVFLFFLSVSFRIGSKAVILVICYQLIYLLVWNILRRATRSYTSGKTKRLSRFFSRYFAHSVRHIWRRGEESERYLYISFYFYILFISPPDLLIYLSSLQFVYPLGNDLRQWEELRRYLLAWISVRVNVFLVDWELDATENSQVPTFWHSMWQRSSFIDK